MKFIQAILPLPIQQLFTYGVPDEYCDVIKVGMRVVVPFGGKRLYTALVYKIGCAEPNGYGVRNLICIMEESPIIRKNQLDFWSWVATYYQANLGDVYRSAVPAGLKLESETNVVLRSDFEAENLSNNKEEKVLNALCDGNKINISTLSKITRIQNVVPTIKQLLEKGAIEVSEDLIEKYHVKERSFVRLCDFVLDMERLNLIFSDLRRARKQLSMLMQYIEMSNCMEKTSFREISKKELLEKTGFQANILNGLAKKGILEIYQKQVERIDDNETSINKGDCTLSSYQQLAITEIEQLFDQKEVVLLHGVTSSGKTELYIELIKKILEKGEQVLYLVPEIALTTQLTSRLRKVFGNRLGVYHSKFSDAERVEIWNNVLNDKSYDIIIGARSSIFLPFRKLGLIVVDEEHETSYKQYDPSPRYHARNAAIVLASMHGAKTILGSATPSIESYHNVKTGKFGLVELKHRYAEIGLPDIVIVDTKEAYRKKQMDGHFSDILIDNIKTSLKNKEQIILFQNRRGYAPYLECKVCGYVPTCKNCDVSLTVHKHFNSLSCHYCGYNESISYVCPSCGTTNSLQNRGFGTEKIEEELETIFPDIRIARMDLDTTRSKKSYEKIIADFELQKIDILIGTQMISKGLDFENVSLVGILNADNMLHFPDFRSHERAFQLMVQVSGRAGRKNRRGLVILQTSLPSHNIIKQVIENDYIGMYEMQSKEREQFKYPPFYRLIQIMIRHRDIDIVSRASNAMSVELKNIFGERVLGPITPSVSRIQNLYIKHLLLKIDVNESVQQAKTKLRQTTENILNDERFKGLRINLDVDPM